MNRHDRTGKCGFHATSRCNGNLQAMMEKDVVLAALAQITTMVVAVGGWVFAWRMQNQVKAVERLQRKVNILKADALARIEHEKLAIERLSELCPTSKSDIKEGLRKAVFVQCGVRPTLTRSRVERM